MKYYLIISKDFKHIKEYDNKDDFNKEINENTDYAYIKIGQSQINTLTGNNTLLV